MEVGEIRRRIMSIFLVVWVITITGQTVYAETEDGSYASNPIPVDGAMILGSIYPPNPPYTHVYTTLDFTAGDGAVSHEAFFSDDPAKVNAREPNVSLGAPPMPPYPTRYYVGLPLIEPYTDSLVRGTKYYWCVDETDGNNVVWQGPVWIFYLKGYKACCPNPPDGAVVLGPDVLLSWVPGVEVDEHDVYFGTDFDDVNNAVSGPFDLDPPPEYLCTVEEQNILVTGLSENTTYYWRVDEVSQRYPPPIDGGTIYKGDVWCFKTAGLIAHWKFDEGTGSVAYDSAGTNDGTIYGAAWARGIIDGALDFDGVDDYVDCGNDNSLNIIDEITLSAWVKADGKANDFEKIVMKSTINTSDPWVLYGLDFDGGGDNATKVRMFASNGTVGSYALAISTTNIQNGIWYHFAGTYNDSELKIYINGLREANTATTFSRLGINDEPVLIGVYHKDRLANQFRGTIDDVRIYNRALSAAEIEELYQSGLPVGQTYHVDGVNGDNTNDGLTPETAFKTIQRGINVAEDFDTVLVWPGVYSEEVAFWGDAITVKSAADAAIVETDYGYAFSFFSAEGTDTVLSNFVIRNSQYGIYLINGSSPTLTNLTIVNNDFGISAFNGADPDISSCIFWNNYYGDLFRDPVPLQARYSCIEEGGEGEGNISIEPGFVDANGGDYHLLSERGRYWPAHDVWVLDDATSPCIDGGDPAVDPSNERIPNGGRINMGAYGNTAYASMSECWSKSDFNCDGIVNFRDFAVFVQDWLETAIVIPGPNVPDVTPPAPAPTIITIGAVSSSSIRMTASEAFDESGVEYYFEALSAGGHDSGWIGAPTYTDAGLIPDTTYCYRVKAWDKSANHNETIWSPTNCAVTAVLPDTLAPLPDPMQWDDVNDANGYNGYPREILLAPYGQFDYGVTMRAIDADDQAPVGVPAAEVEYYFECVDYPAVWPGGFSSGWRTAAAYPNELERRTYTVKVGNAGQALRFRVKARDASDNHNETVWSITYPAH
jgi:parallel beta-helix repeat protein